MSSAARVTGAGAGTGATDAGAVDGEGEGVTMFYNDVYKVQLPPKHKFPMDKYQVRVECNVAANENGAQQLGDCAHHIYLTNNCLVCFILYHGMVLYPFNILTRAFITFTHLLYYPT